MFQNEAVRRFGGFTIATGLTAIVGFAVYYGIEHEPADGGRWTQVLYSSMLLMPAALILGLALVLLYKRASGLSVLGIVALAVLVASPTMVFFLGILAGSVVAGAALTLIGAVVIARLRRPASFRSTHEAVHHSDGVKPELAVEVLGPVVVDGAQESELVAE
jgi:hypothetical protein